MAIQFFVNCPTQPGPSVDDFLHLTATNRASLGVEALVEYYKQNQFPFVVYDWARLQEEPWQIDVPFNKMCEYVTQTFYREKTYQIIHVMNLAYQVDEKNWRNEVMLLNMPNNRFDLAYTYQYASSSAEQRSDPGAFWGPIVETFQSEYTDTNGMGFLDISLASRTDAPGSWKPAMGILESLAERYSASCRVGSR